MHIKNYINVNATANFKNIINMINMINMIKIFNFLIIILIAKSCGDHQSYNFEKSNHNDNNDSYQFFSVEHYQDNHQLIDTSIKNNSYEYLVAFKTNNFDFTDSLISDHKNPIKWVDSNNKFSKAINYQLFYDLYDKYVGSNASQYIEPLMDVNINNHFINENTAKNAGSSNLEFYNFFNSGLDPSKSVITLMSFKSIDKAKKVLNKLYDQNKIWFAEPNNNHNLFQEKNIVESFRDLSKNYKDLVVDNNDGTYHIKMTKTDLAMNVLAKLNDAAIDKIIKFPPIIAIMDSGVDAKHEALNGKIVDLKVFKSSSCIRLNNHGYSGCNTARNMSDNENEDKELIKGLLGNNNIFPVCLKDHGTSCNNFDIPSCNDTKKFNAKEYCEHGTHVAGLSVGYLANKKIYGTCPFCLYLPIRVVNNQGHINAAALLRGFQYASLFYSKDGNPLIRIINSSYGNFSKQRSTILAVRNLQSNGNGILIVAAAGNEDSAIRQYPAGLGNSLAVSNIGQNKKKADSSNYGYYVDIAAPGESINSSYPGGIGGRKSGTSMAAPIVAGIAGLMLAVKPSLTATQLKDIIKHTADKSIYEVNKDYIITTKDNSKVLLLGSGLINAHKAIKANPSAAAQSAKNRRITGCATIGSMTKDLSRHYKKANTKTTNSMIIKNNNIFNDLAKVLLYLLILVLPMLVLFAKEPTNQE